MEWRTVRDADLMECLRVQPLHLGDEIVGRARALEIWKSLLRRRSFASCVVECLARMEQNGSSPLDRASLFQPASHRGN